MSDSIGLKPPPTYRPGAGEKKAEPPVSATPIAPMHGLALAAIVAAIVLVGLLWRPAAVRWGLSGAWILTLVLMALFVATTGKAVTRLWRGVLIDERNRISLSRLQMLVWVLLILSAFLTAALWNVHHSTAPLEIAVPEAVWILLGISTASLVGSPLIKGGKKERSPAPAVEIRDGVPLARPAPPADGLVLVNRDPRQAGWADLFGSEEVGNQGSLDLAKVQMFFFTAVVALAYGATLAAMFAGADEAIRAFPDLDGSLLALLGISHTGYLTHKAMPLSREAK